eukprot:UN0699
MRGMAALALQGDERALDSFIEIVKDAGEPPSMVELAVEALGDVSTKGNAKAVDALLQRLCYVHDVDHHVPGQLSSALMSPLRRRVVKALAKVSRVDDAQAVEAIAARLTKTAMERFSEGGDGGRAWVQAAKQRAFSRLCGTEPCIA